MEKTSRSPVPLVSAGVLLAVFAGIVAWSLGGDAPQAAPAPAAEPPPAPVEPPAAAPPALTAAQAEERLRAATGEWRAFTVKLSRKWPSDRAVAFLEKVTWNDRDPEKQHAHGLHAIRRMLDVTTDDPVALAEALAAKGDLGAFFRESWPRVDVAWEAKPRETVLEDAWKPHRERWGFPLDTPVEAMQAFKLKLVAAQQWWQALLATHLESFELPEGEWEERWREAVGEEPRVQEAKVHAALRVLLDLPQASLQGAVDAFLEGNEQEAREKIAKAVLERMEAAVKAAEAAR